MEQFYEIEYPAADIRLYAGGQWVNDTREPCPACGAFLEATEPPEIEIQLNHLGRRGFVEYLWNSHTAPIFRADLIALWQEAGLTGFRIKPVRITGWYEHPRKPLPENIPTYYWLTTTSKARLTEPPPVEGPCPVCGSIEYAFPKISTHLPNGLRIDPASWDGADFFGLVGYKFVFCTRRVAEITLKAGYNRHLTFVRVEDYLRWPKFNVREWTPKAYEEYVERFLIRRVEDLDKPTPRK
ncbi:MAG: hypothetical protein ACP5N6_15860 [Anaerolineae bacterium]